MNCKFQLTRLIGILLSPLLVLCSSPTDETSSDHNNDSASEAVENETDTEADTAADDSDTDSEPTEWTDTDTVLDSYTEVERAEIGDVPFNQETILEYHISMDPSLYSEMEEEGNDEAYRKASLRVRGDTVKEDYAAVGIRYKGDYSLHHCWDDYGGLRNRSGDCAKLSMSIKFNEYNEDARFFGLKRLDLHAMSSDETKLRERLAYSIFNEFGVTTARTVHAKVYINDQEPILMLAVEHIDGRFTAHRYQKGGDGNLYKETWPVALLSENSLIEQLRSNDSLEDSPDVSAFIDFGNAVAASDKESFLSDMEEYIDFENVLKYMAVDRALKNWDGITAFYWIDRPHNLYWYHDIENSNVFHLIPWDLDKTVWEYDPYMDPVHYNGDRPVPDWNVIPSSCDFIYVWYGSVSLVPPGCDNFITLLAQTSWDQFVVYGQELLDTALQYDSMNEKVTRWADQIAEAVEEDPLLNASWWQATVDNFRPILEKTIVDFGNHLTQGIIIEE